ncbi:MAG: dihydropteroate synthase [Pseudomonadota bacterium]
MSDTYFRPLLSSDAARPPGALSLAGGWTWFDRVACLRRGHDPEIRPAETVPERVLGRLTALRAPIAGLSMKAPRVMGVLNVTPDSFSDGGDFDGLETATAQGRAMAEAGADILDIGGESTRPGATIVPDTQELTRVIPVIEVLAQGPTPISIDTRKAPVAQAALAAGAAIVNDVSALTWDGDMSACVAQAGAPVCLMHALGDPTTMQDDPRYGDVVLDVYDALDARITAAEAAGIPRDRIVIDPGIGFGKTVAHNIALLRALSVFHGLGCAILLGVSRKRFIGVIGREPQAKARMPGSIAVALAAVAQGVQILRVHDVAETVQAIRLFQAVTDGEGKSPEELEAET